MSEKQLKVAVVGNAPFHKKYGATIDECDVVIRFNLFQIKGYKKLVGEKTTIWCCQRFHKKIRKRCESGKIFCKDLWITDSWRNKRQKNVLKRQLQEYGMTPYFIPKAQFKAVSKIVRGNHPSTGIVCLHVALKRFHSPILVFGFNHFQRQARHHYYEKRKQLRVVHNRKMERQYCKMLQQSNSIIFHD